MSKKDLVNSLAIMFFQHQIQMKMYHFQTSLFGSHKAMDTYLEKFNDNFDRFMEVAQGIFGRLTLPRVEISACLLNDDNIIKHLDNYAQILTLISDLINQYSDLMTIRDEMLADVNQLKYLLTFM